MPYETAPPRRRWPLMLFVLAVLIAGLWAGGWYYAAGKLESTVAGWKEREARSGRIYSCASQNVSGFPFRLEVRCTGAGAQLQAREPLSLAAKEIAVTAQVWRPTVLNSRIIGPMTISGPGQPVTITANWRSARTQVHGLPTAPESASIVLDDAVLDRESGGSREIVFKARHAEVEGRMLEGSARANPVIELTLKIDQGTAPSLHPATQKPTDAHVVAVLRGLKDFSPKSWPARFRELQAAGGRIDVTKARVQQGETILAADGVLGLSPNGRLEGELRVIVANLQQLLPALGLDKMTAPDAPPSRLGNAISALDRVMPGLGNVARQNAGPALMASLILLGKPVELEGKRAVALPLRFNDGTVTLGPLPVGKVPPLF